MLNACADPEHIVRRGPTSTTFLVDKGREDPNITIRRAIIGLPAKRNLNDVSLACQ